MMERVDDWCRQLILHILYLRLLVSLLGDNPREEDRTQDGKHDQKLDGYDNPQRAARATLAA